jgi:hypothetical protein
LLSVLVWHKGSDDLGNGFYEYARQRKMLISVEAGRPRRTS